MTGLECHGTAPTAADVAIGGTGFAGTFGTTTCNPASGDSITCTNTYTPTTGDNTGSYTFTATFSGDTNYTASNSPETNNFTIGTNVTTTALASSQNPSSYGQPVTFTATITSDTNNVKGRKQTRKVKPLQLSGNVTWSGNTGCASSPISGEPPQTATCTTSSLPVGSDNVTASYSGDNDHGGSSGSVNQQVNGGVATSISVTSVSPASEVYGQDATVTITAVLSWTGSGATPTAANVTIGGNGPSGYSATNCGSPSGDTMTCTATYTPSSADNVSSYTESAAFSGDSNYAASSSSQTNNFSITQATSTTSVVGNPNPSVYATSVTFTATIDGQYGNVKANARRKNGVHQQAITGTVSWSSNTGCSTSNVTTNPDGSGTATCTTSSATHLPVGYDTVTATYSGDANHSGSSGQETQDVTGSLVTNINVTSVSPSSETYGQDAAVTITAELSWTGHGAPPTASNITIGGNGNGTYSATTCNPRSGDTITCTATYTPTSADVVGSYTETAAFSGDSNYAASTSPQTGNFSIGGATSTTAVASSSPNDTSTYGTSVTFTATITGENGAVKGRNGRRGNAKSNDITGSVTWSTNTGCQASTVSGYPGSATCTTSTLNAGSDTVTATYSGDADHSGSSGSVNQTVNQASQAITFTTNAPSSAAYNSQFTVAATGGGSGNAVTFTSSGVCSNSGTTYTMTSGTGTCSVIANQAGNSNYSAAPTVTQTVNATKLSQTITLSNVPASAVYNSSFTVTATASSGLQVSFSSSGGCTNNGATYTMISGTNSCLVTAQQAGNNNYSAAPPVNQPVAATLASQTITATPPAEAKDKDSFTVSASASSGLPITSWGSSGDCSNSGATYTMGSKAGTCTGTITQAGNGNYSLATYTWNTTVITKLVAPTVTFTGAPSSAVGGSSFTVTATYPNTQGVPVEVPTITGSGACEAGVVTGSGTTYQSTITMTKGSGTCTTTAKWAANFYYAAATEKQETTAELITPTVNFTGAPATAADGTQFTVTASSNETGAYAAVPAITASGSCTAGTASGSNGTYQATITMTKATGTCTTTAKWAATIEYATETLKQTTAP